jgi:hypothetical protein
MQLREFSFGDQLVAPLLASIADAFLDRCDLVDEMRHTVAPGFKSPTGWHFQP